MALKLPNDKIVYNLPEQVAKNAENIEYLATVYKDIDSIPAQFALIKTEFDDQMVPTFAGWAGQMEEFGNDMTTWAGQIDTWANNVGAAAATGITGRAITPSTVSQTAFNYEIAIPLSAATSLTINNIYNRFAVINKVLYVIVNIKLTNETGSDIIVGSGYGLIAQVSMSIDGAVAAALYDLNGQSAAGGATNNTIISSVPCIITTSSVVAESTVFTVGRMSLCNRNASNTVGLQIACNGTTGSRITVHPGDDLFVTGRMALTLL